MMAQQASPPWAVAFIGAEPVIRIPRTGLGAETMAGVLLTSSGTSLMLLFPGNGTRTLERVEASVMQELLARHTVLVHEVDVEDLESANAEDGGVLYEATCHG